jgi:heme/copper-type cytochrome/quinol oxidase subunit 3
MSAAAVELRGDHPLPPPGNPKAEVGWWGMVIFLLNEGALFASLISSYFYLGIENRSWPPAGTPKPELRLPLVMTAVLLSSSVTCYAAEHAHEDGRRARYRAGTLATMLLGAAFLLIQAREYLDKLKHAGPTEHAYESIFFTITGLHGAHVAFGILFLAWALLREWRGTAPPRRPLAIRNASVYWHFVDGVWLVILTSLYLSPRWY